MTYRALMVLRMKPENAEAVAAAFAAPDRGDIPQPRCGAADSRHSAMKGSP